MAFGQQSAISNQQSAISNQIGTAICTTAVFERLVHPSNKSGEALARHTGRIDADIEKLKGRLIAQAEAVSERVDAPSSIVVEGASGRFVAKFLVHVLEPGT